jgi:hypothetical protein
LFNIFFKHPIEDTAVFILEFSLSMH